jgi:hypothetical protein
LQCNVEVVKEPAPDEIARPISHDVIARLSGAPPTEIPLSIISEIRRARHLWRVKREAGASVCEELPPSDGPNDRRPIDLSSVVRFTETERLKPQAERVENLLSRSKKAVGLGRESTPMSSPPLDTSPAQRRACFSEHGTSPTDAPGTSCGASPAVNTSCGTRPGVNRSPPGRVGCLLKPKARSPNLKPISSRSQLEPCNSSREESMLTHTDACRSPCVSAL